MQIPTNSIGVINKVFPHKIVIEIPDTTKINYPELRKCISSMNRNTRQLEMN